MSETRIDTANMHRILKVYKEKMSFPKYYKELPRFNCVDVGFVEDKIPTGSYEPYELLRCAEVKCLRHAYGAHPTYNINMHKMLYIDQIVASTGVECHLIVEWGCGTIGYMNCDGRTRKFRCSLSSVPDERNSDARELMIKIPLGEFTIIRQQLKEDQDSMESQTDYPAPASDPVTRPAA